MKGRRGEAIGEALAVWAVGAWRAGPRLAAGIGLAAFAIGVYAATNLGVNADNRRMLAPDLPFQGDQRAFDRHFPQLDEALLVVIDAETPELAREATAGLREALAENTELFADVYTPGSAPFFEEHGLLYRSADELEEFGDHLAGLQPLLARLSADPSLGTLSELLELGLGEGTGATNLGTNLPAVLDGFRSATSRVFAEHPVALSWEDLLLEGSSLDARRRRVLVAEPRLDYEHVLSASRSLSAIRDSAERLGFTSERGVRVRITGYPALNDEEMRGLVNDIGVASVFSFGVVGVLLVLALRWKRFVAATAITLVVGLAWTAAFAAAAVGDLNFVSIAFAVLFIGLGADFAIHLGLHLIDESREGRSPEKTLERVALDLGATLLLCAVTTAIGFLAFVPTDYRGVAELGLIAAFGMLAIFALTLTLIPALLGESRPEVSRGPGVEARLRTASTGFIERRPGTVVGLFAVALGIACALAPLTRFDSNVIAMRDPATESVQAFEDLLEDDASPWTIEVLAPDPEAARRRAALLVGLETVSEARTLADFVPEDQQEKLEILADVSLLFDAPTSPAQPGTPSVESRVAALRRLATVLEATALAGNSRLAASARRLRDVLRDFLERLSDSPDPALELAHLEEVLLGRFPERMERLTRALATGPVQLADLPETLVRRMRAPDGTERIQVFPSKDLGDPNALERFVAEVRSLEPHATGLPVVVVEFGRYTAKSLREALLGAFGAIALLLTLLWRRPGDTFLALLPVMAASLLSVGSMAALGRPFNFVNVIVLPLLLGVGVDSGVHLVRRARLDTHTALGDTATARGVFYSALTTLMSFGSLATASHPGLASLGLLLVIGMLWTLVCNLVLLPALLVLADRSQG